MRTRTVTLISAGQGGPPASCIACGAPLGQAPSCPTCGWIADARLGATVGGRYRIDAFLGEGGFGRVYRATALPHGAPVAIKFLHHQVAARPDVRARFQREAAVLSRLRDPGIVAAHEFGEDAGALYLVMELVDGQALADVLIDDQIVFAPAAAVRLLDQLLRILEVAHGSGVVHRDIKPENVMLLRAHPGVIKVLDFGLAFFEGTDPSDRITATRMTFGSPCYMSPEQCRSRDVHTPTDVYAAGVILYELLSGAPPFLGESAAEIIARHIHEPPPPIAQHGARRPAPPALEALVRWALTKRAQERPTATAFRQALAQAAEALRG